MELEMRKAADLVKITKEKISFGLLKVFQTGDLSAELKVDKIPSLIAIK